MQKNTAKDTNKRKVLFLVGQETGLVPGQRFRFEQYLTFLENNNIECEISPLVYKQEGKTLYSKGKYLAKLGIFKNAILRRYKDLKKIKQGQYDAVFIYRDALMIRSIYFEKKIHKLGVPMIYDFDDSIWLNDVSDANRSFAWLKNPAKVGPIISMCSLVIAGNEYLRDYALNFNPNVQIIPTTIDTQIYQAGRNKNGNEDVVTIGWSGSITTIKHFKTAVPVLEVIRQKFGSKVQIKVIGDGTYEHKNLEIKGKWWDAATEIEDLSEFDIGIMPLPDDAWSKGKCGLKGLQYMALEIPTIMSPVGVNTEIIHDGENGFLASTHQEWVEKLSQLIESAHLRKKLGENGCKTVSSEYSVEANKEKWLDAFNSVLQGYA
ncbi:MAG: glycosyltransferase family 4 protein [Bacteroidota bacterium]